jgi:hypothetical protein
MFTFTHESEGHKVTVQSTDEEWHDVVMRFEEFLRGCGYVFDEPCHLEMVKDR